MAQLKTKVVLYLEANSKTWNAEKENIVLQNDASNDYIKVWSVNGLSEPTDSELNALETQADDYEYNLGQIAKRKAEYGTLEQQMENVMENGVTAEKNRVQAIKDKYPKK